MLMNVEVQKCRLQFAKSVNDKKDSFFFCWTKISISKFSNEGSVLFCKRVPKQTNVVKHSVRKSFLLSNPMFAKKGCFHFVVGLRTFENLIIIAMTLKNKHNLNKGIISKWFYFIHSKKQKKIV